MTVRALGIVTVIGLLALVACGQEGKEGSAGGGGGNSGKKPTPGDACPTDGERACLSPEQQAICQGGQWRSFPCAGPDACASSGGTTTCDISGNKTDDSCAAADNGKSVCSGGKERVTCAEGKIKRDPCRGPNGCTEDGDKTSCDMTINVAGEACTTEGASSCTVDQKQQLGCKNGQWITLAPCRGPKGCYLAENKIWCDSSIAVKGDTCLNEGTGTCSQDGGGELVCKNGKYVWYYRGRCRY